MATRGGYAKGDAKREEILAVALELFATTGYDKVSVREIARRSGLSQAGLLHHFSTKEELFLEVLRRRDERLPAGTSPELLHPVEKLIAAVERNADEPGLVRLFVSLSAEATKKQSQTREFFQQRYQEILGAIVADIRGYQEQGLFPPEVDAEDAASLLVAVADGLQTQWLLGLDHIDMAERLRLLWSLLGGKRS